MLRKVCSAAMAAELVKMLVIGICPGKESVGTCRSGAEPVTTGGVMQTAPLFALGADPSFLMKS